MMKYKGRREHARVNTSPADLSKSSRASPSCIVQRNTSAGQENIRRRVSNVKSLFKHKQYEFLIMKKGNIISINSAQISHCACFMGYLPATALLESMHPAQKQLL